MFSDTSIQLTPQDFSVKVSPPSNKRMTSAKSKDTISISSTYLMVSFRFNFYL